MAKQGPGLSCILLPRPIDHHREVVDILGEIDDVSSAAIGTTMATAVELGDSDARGSQGRPHVAIESAVCGIAVNHDQR
jgi:hypothetical protein